MQIYGKILRDFPKITMHGLGWVINWGFLKWWYTTTIGFLLKMIVLGCFGGTGNTQMVIIMTSVERKHVGS